jgi:pyruvate,water dikinase
MEWDLDDLASTTHPLYSRAVVGDLCPDPVTPLTATAGVGAHLGPAWARCYAETGLRPAGSETPPGAEGGIGGPAPVAMFGAYLYLNTSLLRLFGVYACGADPMSFARQYLGERPDVPRQHDERPALGATAERLPEWTSAVLSGRGWADPPSADGLPGAGGPQRADTDPASLADAELAGLLLGLGGELRAALGAFARAELAAAVASDLLTRTTEEAGHPSRTGELVAGSGAAVTEPVRQLWRLAVRIGESGSLTRLFDRGIDTLVEQLGTAPGARLLPGLTPLLARYGHLGGREWELSSDTWGTEPRLALALLDALRRADPGQDPATRVRDQAASAGATAATVRHSLRTAPLARDRFDTALAALTHWLGVRQATRQAVSALHHRQRRAARELGRRHIESGLLDEPDQICMLLAGELGEFIAEPARFGESLRMRAYDYHALRTFRPPFVTLGQPPPVVRWPRQHPGGPTGPTGVGAAGRRVPVGTAVAAGARVCGPARVLLAPCSAARARPGDVLVLPTAGPEWVPLVGLAAAVVVDDGSALSDTALACRDLGVPCVAATVELTLRASRNAIVEVDGVRGAVRLAGRGGAAGSGPAGEPHGRAEPFGQSERHASTNPA